MTMTKPKEVTDAQFEGEVLKAETPVLAELLAVEERERASDESHALAVRG